MLQGNPGDHESVVRREASRTARRRPSSTSATPAFPASCIRIALMSDSSLFRSGLKRILATDRALLVATDIAGPSARDVLRKNPPHILLIDAQMEDALAVCYTLRQPGMRPWVILAGANANDDRWAVQALKAGARGILAKTASVETLLKATHMVHQGQLWASNRVIARCPMTAISESAVVVAVSSMRVLTKVRTRFSPTISTSGPPAGTICPSCASTLAITPEMSE